MDYSPIGISVFADAVTSSFLDRQLTSADRIKGLQNSSSVLLSSSFSNYSDTALTLTLVTVTVEAESHEKLWTVAQMRVSNM